jgi:hypothetical protein
MVLANGYRTVLEQRPLLAKNCVATDKTTQKREKMNWLWGIETTAVSAEITRIRKERNRHQGVHNMNNYKHLVEIT